MDEQLKEQLRRAYDLKAAERDTQPIAPWRQGPRNDFAALLKREGKVTLLELGSGPGNDGLYFQSQGFKVLCTDLSTEMIRLCQAKGLTARVMDNTRFDLEPASFDAVYAMNSLLHLPKSDLPAVLAGIKTVLKPGGLFFMSVYGGPDSEGIWQGDKYEPKRFFSFYSDNNLRQILSRFFNILTFASIPYDGKEPEMTWQTAVLSKKPE